MPKARGAPTSEPRFEVAHDDERSPRIARAERIDGRLTGDEVSGRGEVAQRAGRIVRQQRGASAQVDHLGRARQRCEQRRRARRFVAHDRTARKFHAHGRNAIESGAREQVERPVTGERARHRRGDRDRTIETVGDELRGERNHEDHHAQGAERSAYRAQKRIVKFTSSRLALRL